MGTRRTRDVAPRADGSEPRSNGCSDDAPYDPLARCVGQVSRFFEDVWTCKPQHYRDVDSTHFADVLSLDAIDALLAPGGLRAPALRMVRGGKAIPRSSYTSSQTTAGTRIDDAIDSDAVLRAFAGGATLVLQGLHRFLPSVQRFCAGIEGTVGHPVQANAYLTPAGGERGLGVHHDTHDVFVLQLFGTKRWRLYGVETENPVARFPTSRRYADPGEPVSVHELTAGDCLYLPRGVPHDAESLETAALHLTLGVRSPTWLDVMQRVFATAHEHPELRESLPVAYADDPGAFEAATAQTLDRAAKWLASRDPARIARQEIARRVAPPVARRGRLMRLASAGPIESNTPLERIGPPWTLSLHEAHATLSAPNRRVRLRFPARVAPALRVLVDASEFCAEDLGDLLDPPGALVLVRRLHREGLVHRTDVE
ncbi:MAG: hypothetical protein H6719_09125 [Sandaracinaceae bacterium]|nr:hypothetical protein [Sandaracinaceae bacterium]